MRTQVGHILWSNTTLCGNYSIGKAAIFILESKRRFLWASIDSFAANTTHHEGI
ncbi:MAG: hypothetical protein QG577_491 [Thermodesulfobacteriota bacterium]|nr:hypothetical protein [Thermodesulfobacteriota bacterium]